MHRLLVALGVVLCAVGLSACHGPVSTRTITTTVDCSTSEHPTPIVHTLTISLDSTSKASVGAAIHLANFTLSGFGGSAVIARADMTTTGLATWSVPGLPAQFSADNDFVNVSGEADGSYGTESTTITGAIGTDATVDFADLYVGVFVGTKPVVGYCIPEVGQPTRLSTIAIFDGGGR